MKTETHKEPRQVGYNVEMRTYTYRGVTIEIARLGHLTPRDGQTHHFCLYILLAPWNFRNTTLIRLLSESRKYRGESFLKKQWGINDIFEAANQGETYHQVMTNGIIKIGCDYNHAWNDERRDWGTWLGCLHDGKVTVDYLHERLGGLMVSDRKNGDIITEAEAEARESATTPPPPEDEP